MNIRIQIFAFLFSVILFFIIYYFLRNRKIKEEYAILWLIAVFLFALVSVYRPILNYISVIMGIAYPPAALFLIIFVCLLMLNIHFSIEISRIKEDKKNLAQDLALLQNELLELKGAVSGKNN